MATLRRMQPGTLAAHLALLMALAAMLCAAIKWLWYPFPYDRLAGGNAFALVMVLAILICGAVLAALRWSPKRPIDEPWLLLLLLYGALAVTTWLAVQNRPVYLVFEFDRFRVVRASDVPRNLLDKAPAGLATLPTSGPELLSLRPFRNSDEQLQNTMAALHGLPLAARPEMWQAYGLAANDVIRDARENKNPAKRPMIGSEGARQAVAEVLQKKQLTEADVGYLPVVSEKKFWTAVTDLRTGKVVGFMPVDLYG